MPIQYCIVENKLTSPVSYTGKPVPIASIDIDDMAELINLSEPLIPKSAIKSTLELLKVITRKNLLLGNRITLTNFISFFTSIQFRSGMPSDLISRDMIEVHSDISQQLVDDVLDIASYTDLGCDIKLPVLLSATDTNTGINNWIRGAFPLKVYGNNLVFNPSDETQGIFLTSPAGNTYRIDNISLISNKNVIFISEIDTEQGPAGPASVAYQIAIKARYTANGSLRTGTYSMCRATVEISGSNEYLFVVGSAASGPARVVACDEADVYGRILAYIRPDDVLTLAAASLLGEMGTPISVVENGTYEVDGIAGLQIEVVDYNTLYANALAYQRNLQEIVFIASLAVYAIELGPPIRMLYEAGASFFELTKGRVCAAIEGDRFVWISEWRSGGSWPKAQTVVGTVDSDGVCTYGTMTEHTLGGGLSLNSYGAVPIGNNKFARWRSQYSPYTSGYAVFDCGETGLTATLLEENDNGIMTYFPGGWYDSVLHSNGKMYFVTGTVAPDYNKCVIEVCSINNTTGVTSSAYIIDSAFGANRTVYYNGGDFGVMQGKAIPGGGVAWLVKTADLDESSNPKLELVICDGTDVNRYQCDDLNGDPIALAFGNDGIFTIAYRTTTGVYRIRVGTIASYVPTFGDYIDMLEGAGSRGIYPADMVKIENNRFVCCVQDDTYEQAGMSITFETDGDTINCLDTIGINTYTNTCFNLCVLLPLSYEKKVLVGTYSCLAIGNRNNFMQFIMPDPNSITAGVEVDINVGLQEYDYYAIEVSAGYTSITVDLTDLTNDLDLYIKKGLRPNSIFSDDRSENSGTTPEQVSLSNTGKNMYYISIFGYEAGEGKLMVTLS